MSIVVPISVVIPTMNRPDTLAQTIRVLMNQEYIPKQLIIVDQSETAIKRHQNEVALNRYSKITNTTYLYQATPSSTQARNFGLSKVSCNIIVYSDDDVDVNKQTLKQMYNLMLDEEVAMVGALDNNSSDSQTKIGYLLGTKSYRYRKIGHVTKSILGRYPNHIQGQVDTQWAMGYFFAVKKQLIDKWNVRWDENLISYAYAEDLDFSWNYYKCASKENLRCILDESVSVSHLVSKEYRIPSFKSTQFFVINREYLSYKHKLGIRSRFATRWVNFCRFCERIVHREKPMDMLKAQWICDRQRKYIKSNALKYYL